MTLRWAYSPEKCEGYEFCGDCDTCPIRDEAKPTVFNYGDYLKLKSKSARQADEILKLKQENTDLKVALFSAYLILKAEAGEDVRETDDNKQTV